MAELSSDSEAEGMTLEELEAAEKEAEILEFMEAGPYQFEPTKEDFKQYLKSQNITEAEYEQQITEAKEYSHRLEEFLKGRSLDSHGCQCGGFCHGVSQYQGSSATFLSHELICCEETDFSKTFYGYRLRPIGSHQCITQCPPFVNIILNPIALRIYLNQEEELKFVNREDDEELTVLPSNKQLRYAAFRATKYWIYGQLGGREELELPLCIIQAVRQAFPDPSGRYYSLEQSTALHSEPPLP